VQAEAEEARVARPGDAVEDERTAEPVQQGAGDLPADEAEGAV